VGPIYGDVLAQADQQFVGNHAQLVVTHHLQGGFILRKRVVEGDFIRGQTLFLTAAACGTNVLGKLDQFLQHLDGGDGIGVVARNGVFQPFCKGTCLDHIGAAARADAVTQQLA